MSDQKSTIDELMSKLRQERDELRLQMHLASMEARDEYDRLSEKYDQMTDHFAPVQDVVEETASNVYSAFGLLADELYLGFNRLRKTMSGK